MRGDALVWVVIALGLAACDPGAPCVRHSDCPPSLVCDPGGACVVAPADAATDVDAAVPDAATDVDAAVPDADLDADPDADPDAAPDAAPDADLAPDALDPSPDALGLLHGGTQDEPPRCS